MQNGLRKATNPKATVKMFPTYVRKLPTGHECGQFLALDLGGTNFRILLIELDDGKVHMDSKIYAVPQDIMLGTGEQLFDHIAECLANFVKEFKVQNKILPLGFTFSFPCKQSGLTKASLVRWTKGFNCSGVVDQDIVNLLRNALEKRSVNINVVALVNDTTGTLMSCAYKARDCMIGVIIGTGTNACYMENLDNVELWEEDRNEPQQVIVNCEWGAFGDNGALDFIRTEYDKTIDENSINAGTQIYEKMISGMYMGELVRLVLLRLIEENLIFDGKTPHPLKKTASFETKYVSKIEDDGGLDGAREVMKELGLKNASDDDCAVIKTVCTIVSERAANLTAAGIATLLCKINKPLVSVGIDGSVYRFHPYFSKVMSKKIRELIPNTINYHLLLSEDGSGKGAALVAAVAASSSN
ncbi:Hexokinase-2 [Chamberlinius hualienensis]